jgi:hypothetical protein
MTGDRFVNTLMARSAVEGHEIEILVRLGVNWRAGRPHITCPFLGHDDRHPSWRWDEVKFRAFCSCTPRGEDIFGVIEKIKGLDFEGAKIFALEAIGRTDLIRSKSDISGQRHDAASLLGAPADRRDDTLPIAYLGYRLGIPDDQVPIPTTPMVGLKALAYFDPPPPGSRAKPKLVGEFPCCVYGTLGPDGKTHAHRIYTAPGGAGKADLGTGPNGRPRDAKKSATLAKDDRTTGRCVLWGDPDSAPHLMGFEGIENAAAAAVAFRPEIDSGEIVVASAISAAGIAGMKPFSATKQVTIGADRDEAPKPSGEPGSRAGEIAARQFALRHHETIAVGIAVPGQPGEDVDWLDILRRDGPGAVRAGLIAAVPFMPTPAERDDRARNHERAAELKR